LKGEEKRSFGVCEYVRRNACLVKKKECMFGEEEEERREEKRREEGIHSL